MLKIESRTFRNEKLLKIVLNLTRTSNGTRETN